MKRKSRFLILLLLLVMLVPITSVMAKGSVDLITIEGPGLKKPNEITDPDILSRFNPWVGQFIGTGSPLAGPPPNIKEPYLVKFYLEDLQGELILRYVFYYYRNSSGKTGYIYLPGTGEPYYQINAGTIIRGKSDGKWHNAIPGWDDVMANAIGEPHMGSFDVAGLKPAQANGVFLGIGGLLTFIVAYFLWVRRQPKQSDQAVSKEGNR